MNPINPINSIKFESIKDENCCISFETIGTLVKSQARGLPFVLAVIESANNHCSYFDARAINRYFTERKIENPNNRETDFKIRYLWNAKTEDIFEPLTEFNTDELRKNLPVPPAAFLKINGYATTCNEADRATRIEGMLKILLAMNEHTDPTERADWTKLLYNEFLHGISDSILKEEAKLNFSPFHSELCQVYKKSSDPLLLPCLFASAQISPYLRHHTLDGILAQFPNDELSLLLKAILYMRGDDMNKQDMEKANFIFQKMAEFNAKTTFSYQIFANEFMYGKYGVVQDYAKAFEYLTKACAIDSKSEWVHVNLAMLYYKGADGVAKDWAKALEHYTKAIELKPKNAISHVHLGMLYSERNGVAQDCAKALKHLTKAIELAPNNPKFAIVHEKIGNLYRIGENGVARDYTKAFEHFTKAIELDPNNPRLAGIHEKIGILYRIGGNGVPRDYAKALEHYTTTIELDPKYVIAHANMGALYRIGGNGVAQNCAKALEHLTKAIELDANTAFAHSQMGALYLTGGNGVNEDRIKSRNYFLKALELEPDNAIAKSGLEDLMKSEGT